MTRKLSQKEQMVYSTIARLEAERDQLQRDLTARDEELAQCEAMSAMIAEREWAEHVGTGPVSSKAEAAFTQLHNDLHEAGAQPAEQHQGEPIMLTAVATLIDDGDGGLEASWLLEGGTAELFAGMTLLVAENSPELCQEDGTAPVYTHADPGEVERLRCEVSKWRGKAGRLTHERDGARAQLAERDALLREIQDGTLSGYARYSKIEAVLSASAEPCAPVMQIPEGYCVMPRRLTAENGAKALLLGEFKLEVTQECPECRELDEPIEGCEICDGEGEYGQSHMIPWDKIKFIYSEAVKGLALQPSNAQ